MASPGSLLNQCPPIHIPSPTGLCRGHTVSARMSGPSAPMLWCSCMIPTVSKVSERSSYYSFCISCLQRACFCMLLYSGCTLTCYCMKIHDNLGPYSPTSIFGRSVAHRRNYHHQMVFHRSWAKVNYHVKQRLTTE